MIKYFLNFLLLFLFSTLLLGQQNLGNLTYFQEHVCGLNYLQFSQITETRTQAVNYNFNTNGTGLPTTDTVSGLPDSCMVIQKAYLYFSASYTEDTVPVSVGIAITNPALITHTYTADTIGTGPPVGWGETGTAAYRADVTSSIAGNGAYGINITGFQNPSWEVDGVSLFIIYSSGPSGQQSGNLILVDGIISDSVSDATVSIQGFSICATNSGSAFSLYSDMQKNYNNNIDSNSYNRTSVAFANNFWNFNQTVTTFTTGQASTELKSYTNNGRPNHDGYSWIMAGIYWHDTCYNCKPIISFNTVNATCGLCNGAASANVGGGTSPYTYYWQNNGNTTATTTGLCAGTYTLSVEDAICNTSTASVILTATPAVVVSANITQHVSCNGGSNGIATETISSGNSPYTYSWTPGANTHATATGLSVGTYTVLVTDINGCSASASVSISQPMPLISNTTDSANIFCYGGSNGSASVSASGGTPIYRYSWTPGGNTSSNATGLTAGNYTVTVTDDNGCTSTSGVTITQPPTMNPLASEITDVSCYGGSNGSATATESGGTSPYAYSWSPNNALSDTITRLSAGVYVVTITDSNGCSQTASVRITQPLAPISATFTTAFGCRNASCIATASVSGGTSPYAYSWNNGGTTASISGISAGTYTLSVTDANGCTYTSSVVATQPALLSVVIGNIDNVLCYEQDNGSASLTASGGNPVYTYSWAPNGKTTNSITGLSAGTYSITVTDNKGCTATATVAITQPNPLSISHFVDTNVRCHGEDNGNSTPVVIGGTPVYTYSWAHIGGTNATAGNLSAGTYTVTVTDAHGCTVLDSTIITQPPVLNYNYAFNYAHCDSNNGSITIYPYGGTPPYTYSWSPGGQTTQSITGLSVGTYTVTITDSHGCTITEDIVITLEPLQVDITNNILCTGGDSASAIVYMIGGTSPYSYSWSLGGQTTQSITGLVQGIYTVSVTDSTGCREIRVFTIFRNMDQIIIDTLHNIRCNGGDSGVICVQTIGGSTPYTYSWMPGNQTTTCVTGLTAGNYTVNVTDSNRCTASLVISVTQPPVLTATLNVPDNVLCYGENNGMVVVTASGGTTAYTYSWSPTGGTKDSAGGLRAGTYTITVKDAHHCAVTASIVVTQPPRLTVSITTILATCVDSLGELTAVPSGGTSPYTYLWLPYGDTTAEISNLNAGTYTVNITDAHGCQVVDSAIMRKAYDRTVSVAAVSCYGGSNGSATVEESGGNSPFTYSWAPTNQTTATATGLSAGTYTVTITDSNNCQVTTNVIISQPSQLIITININSNVSCYGGNNGSAIASPFGGVSPYNYSWVPGGTHAYITGLNAGVYTVIVTDSHDCSATASIAITQPPPLTATITDTTNVLCFGGSTGSATVTASGGTPGYSYSWSPAGGNQSQGTGLHAGTYTVTVRDANNCIVTASVIITQSPAIVITDSITNVSCHGGQNGFAKIIATRGVSPYTYSWAPGGNTTDSISGLSAGVYTITVTDSNSCISSATVTISQPMAITISITPTNLLCNNINTGVATSSVSGGTPAYTYSWSPGGGTSANITGLSAGTFTLSVTDKNGCTSTSTVSIAEPLALVIYSVVTVPAPCAQSTGSATAYVGGGTPSYHYSWSPGGQTGVSATGLSAGSYTLTVTDANSCTITANVSIFNSASLLLTNNSVTCYGYSNGNAHVFISGGTPPFTYLWTPSNQTSATATGLSAGTYTVTIRDADSCTSQTSVAIAQPPPIIVTPKDSINELCYGNCMAITSVLVTGGTPAYRYSWSPVGGSNTIATGLCMGTYTITISDANSCIAQASVTITQPPLLTAIMEPPVNVLCNGQSNGSASLIASGGTSPYTYSWSPAAGSNAGLSGLTVGTYSVLVTDSHNCTASASVTITQPPILTLAMNSPMNILCNGGNNGSASLTASGGTSPYTYSWSPVAGSNALLSGLSAGIYSVTISDNNGCTISASVTITQPPTLTLAMSSPVNVLCNGGNNGSDTAIASGGTSPYTYSWSPVAGSNALLSGLSAGIYSVTITDNNGCTASASITITQPPALIVIMSIPVNVLCNGGNNGSVSVTASGGTSPYTYSWSPIADFNAIASGLSAGTYSVTVTDNNSCTASASVTITQPSILTATIGATVNVLCNGGSNGSASITASGGTAPYTYSWSPIAGSNATLTGLSAGTYSVTVTDSHGCTASASVTITQPLTLTVAMSNPMNVLCNGGTNGSDTAIVRGGTFPYTYSWSPIVNSNAIASGLSVGMYSVFIMDNNSCTATASVTITQPPILSLAISNPVNVLCNGGSNGSASVTASGGTSPYTYSWSPIADSNAVASGLSAGNYSVIITDNNSCTASASVTITQPPILTATMSSPINVWCNGGSNGSASLTASGGTSPYTYSWSPIAGSNNTLSGLSAGSYSVTVTDADSCIASASVTITQPPILTVAMGIPINVLCNGGTNGSDTAIVTGGTLPYTYSWSPIANSNAVASGLSVGTYSVFITDNNGCTATASVTITQPTTLIATMSIPMNVLCNGGANGSDTSIASGGTFPYTYSWSPNAETTAIASGLSAGTYSVIITDNNSCTASASVTITQPSILTVAMGSPVNVLCNGGSNGSASLTASGGTSPYTYSWSPVGGTNATASGLSAGTYSVTVTDNDNCTATASVMITQPPQLSANGHQLIAVSCNGGNNGSASVTVSGGVSPYTYSWSPLAGSNATLSGLSAGIYSVTVTDSHSCTAIASITITQPPQLSANGHQLIAVSCNGGSNGSASVTATGGTSPYMYSWSPVAGSNTTLSGLSAGTYSVTVTDSNSCTARAIVTITQPHILTASMGVPVNVSCNGGSNGSASLSLSGGTPAYTYLWTPSGQTIATATGLSAGNYTVSVTDANSCTTSSSVLITEPTQLSATITSSVNVSCNAGNSGSATVSAGGGTTNYSYSWNPSGGTNATATGLIAGNYTITVTDAHSCTATATVTITQPTALAASATVLSNITCFGGNEGSAALTVSGGILPYTYSWTSNVSSGTTATGLTAGIYTIMVTDSNHCKVSVTATITQPLNLIAAVGAKNVSCNGEHNGSINLNVSGGTGPYTYSWTPIAAHSPAVSGLSAGTYSVTISDANGCTASANVVITEPLTLILAMVGPQSICAGQSGVIAATVTGGTSPYIYSWSNGATTSTITIHPLANEDFRCAVTDANGCADTSTIAIELGPPLLISLSGPSSVCSGNPISLCAKVGGGMGNKTYTWHYIANGQQLIANSPCITVSPTTTTVYSLIVRDDCGADTTVTDTVKVIPLPRVDFISDVAEGCPPLCIRFQNLTDMTAGNDVSWLWLFGNGDSVTSQNPVYCYKNPGSYSIGLTVTSSSGCSGTLSMLNMINVYSAPVARFTLAPQPTTILAPEIQFTNKTTDNYGIAYWFWNFGDPFDPQVGSGGSTSYLENPSHTYSDTGSYCARLIAMNIHGCTDTTTNCLVISPLFSLYIPSAFTPNGDGLNDSFMAKGHDVKTFEMYIFDRWGMQLFHSNDINTGWPGTINGGHVICQEDTYVYMITATDDGNIKHNYIGKVTLIK